MLGMMRPGEAVAFTFASRDFFLLDGARCMLVMVLEGVVRCFSPLLVLK